MGLFTRLGGWAEAQFQTHPSTPLLEAKFITPSIPLKFGLKSQLYLFFLSLFDFFFFCACWFCIDFFSIIGLSRLEESKKVKDYD